MELCGDCKYYYELNGKGCCKVKLAFSIRKDTNMHCLNWEPRKEKNTNAMEKHQHQQKQHQS